MPDLIAVVGAGTMGAGIAQVAAAAGHPVLLYDAVPGAADRAAAALPEVSTVESLAGLAPARVVVEAVVEDLDVKRRLFADLEGVVAADCVLASNTSSLSPTALAAGLAHPERVVGLHFFNPVPRMRLVEVVPGLATAPEVADAVTGLATAWGKTAVRATPTPGFIVNRVARPFYGEAWRLYEEHAADPATIDRVLTGAGGFRMGPFALMDLIGHDVNEAVTRTVWAAFGHDPRFAPSSAQRELVAGGWLGRKTGRGVYTYPGGPEPVAAAPCKAPPAVAADADLHGLVARAGVALEESGTLLVRCLGTTATELAARYGAPVVVVDRTLDDATATAIAVAASDGCPADRVDEAVGLLQAAGLEVYVIDDTPGLIVTRTVAMLVNLAVDALHQRVATAADLDTAMRLGTSYPIGPLEWGERWGHRTVHSVLSALQEATGDPRYRPSPLLRRKALAS
jgi:3-hydroxybutyryl-CoA dehydrogenase